MLDCSEVPATHNCPAPALAPVPFSSISTVANVSCFASQPGAALLADPTHSLTPCEMHTHEEPIGSVPWANGPCPPIACVLASWFLMLSA